MIFDFLHVQTYGLNYIFRRTACMTAHENLALFVGNG